jgi:hypothetical protein
MNLPLLVAIAIADGACLALPNSDCAFLHRWQILPQHLSRPVAFRTPYWTFHMFLPLTEKNTLYNGQDNSDYHDTYYTLRDQGYYQLEIQ